MRNRKRPHDITDNRKQPILLPLTLLWFQLGSSTNVPFRSIFAQLSLTVVLPVFVGQIFRAGCINKIHRLGIPFGTISRLVSIVTQKGTLQHMDDRPRGRFSWYVPVSYACLLRRKKLFVCCLFWRGWRQHLHIS